MEAWLLHKGLLDLTIQHTDPNGTWRGFWLDSVGHGQDARATSSAREFSGTLRNP